MVRVFSWLIIIVVLAIPLLVPIFWDNNAFIALFILTAMSGILTRADLPNLVEHIMYLSKRYHHVTNLNLEEKKDIFLYRNKRVSNYISAQTFKNIYRFRKLSRKVIFQKSIIITLFILVYYFSVLILYIGIAIIR